MIPLGELDVYISKRDTEFAVPVLEKYYEKKLLEPSDRLLLGVLLLLPPFADHPKVRECLETNLGTEFEFESLVWLQYNWMFWPKGETYDERLSEYQNHSVACYMFALKAEYNDCTSETIEWIKKGLQVSPFPNLLDLADSYATICPEFSGSKAKAKGLIKVRDLEKHSPPDNRQQVASYYWDHLILGTKVTTPIWESCFATE